MDWRHGTTVTWLKCSIAGCSPLLEEVGDLEVGPMLDDYQAEAQAAHREFGLLSFAQVVHR